MCGNLSDFDFKPLPSACTAHAALKKTTLTRATISSFLRCDRRKNSESIGRIEWKYDRLNDFIIKVYALCNGSDKYSITNNSVRKVEVSNLYPFFLNSG